MRDRFLKALAFVQNAARPLAKNLTEETAGPDVTGVRPLTGGHPAQGLTPLKLANLLREAETGDATAYLELAEEMEEKDLHYAAVLGVRKRAIRGMTLIVDPASDDARDKEAAEFVEAQLNKSTVQLALTDMLDGLGKGYSVSEILWKRDGAQWEIGKIEYRFPQWFETSRDDGCTLLIKDLGGPLPMVPGKFVIHRPTCKSGLPIRGGLARLAAWAYLFKNFTIKDWAVFCEAYGHPLRLGKYGSNVTDKEKTSLLRAVRNIGADMAAIVPESMDIEFISASLSGNAQFYEKKARYWDEQMSKGILGQVATTDAIAGGHAVGKIHEAVRDDIRDADAEQLGATLERDLAAPLTVFNFGNEVGVPSIRFEASDEVPLSDFMRGVETLNRLNLPVASAPVYKRLGLSAPQPDEDVIGQATPPPKKPEAGPVKPGDDPDAGDDLALAMHDHGRSSIDDLTDAMTAELGFSTRPDIGLDAIESALAGASTLDELKASLAGLAADGGADTFIDLLARGTSIARVAGEAGAPVLDNQPVAE